MVPHREWGLIWSKFIPIALLTCLALVLVVAEAITRIKSAERGSAPEIASLSAPGQSQEPQSASVTGKGGFASPNFASLNAPGPSQEPPSAAITGEGARFTNFARRPDNTQALPSQIPVAVREQVGPSFDCHVAQQPLAQMLCADAELSRVDLRFAQAYWALLRQVGDGGSRELRQEDLRFLDAVQQQCGIPHSGSVVPQTDVTRNCVKNAYEAQRTVWVLRLMSPFSEEANRPIERHIALQRALQQLGFLSADAVIDGVYGAGTREAISRWQQSQNRNSTGALGDADASVLEQEAPKHAHAPAFIEPRASKPEVPKADEPEKPSANASSPAFATAAETTERYTDPFEYCRAVGTIDRPDARYKGPAIPANVVAALEFLPGTLGMDHIEWRCAKGKLMGCVSTKAPVCSALTESEKSRTPTNEMVKYCREHPSLYPMPQNVVGYNNLYKWNCESSSPVIGGEIISTDEQGYNASLWKVVNADFRVTPNYDLWRASAAGDLPAIERALDAGAEVNAKMHNGHTALSLAVFADRVTIARCLLDHAADRDWLSATGGTLLARVGSVDMVDLLIDHRVDPNKADKNGYCPLLWSVWDTAPTRNGKAVSIELLAKGATVSCTNRSGFTPLHLVRDPDLTKLLIERGADVNALDNGGFTPLHQAAGRGSLDVVRTLITAGAKNLRSKQNQLPIDLARASSGKDPAGSATRAELIDVLSRLPVPAVDSAQNLRPSPASPNPSDRADKPAVDQNLPTGAKVSPTFIARETAEKVMREVLPREAACERGNEGGNGYFVNGSRCEYHVQFQGQASCKVPNCIAEAQARTIYEINAEFDGESAAHIRVNAGRQSEAAPALDETQKSS